MLKIHWSPVGAISGFTLTSLYFTNIDDFHNKTILKAYISLDPAIPFVQIYYEKYFRVFVYIKIYLQSYLSQPYFYLFLFFSLIFNNKSGKWQKIEVTYLNKWKEIIQLEAVEGSEICLDMDRNLVYNKSDISDKGKRWI